MAKRNIRGGGNPAKKTARRTGTSARAHTGRIRSKSVRSVSRAGNGTAKRKKSTSRTLKKTDRRAQTRLNGKAAKRMMNPVVHFEIPMENPVRISEFYQKAFGWNTLQLGEEHGGYILAQTGETTKDGMLKKKAMINGGFYHKDMKRPAQYPTLVIAVDDLTAAVERIEKAGGKVVGNPIPIPGYGTYVSFVDTEGNRLEVIEPTKEMKSRK